MNLALLKFGLRYHRKHKLQTALLLLGISLGVALVVSIDIANVSAERSFRLSTASITGSTTHVLRGVQGELPDSLYRELRVDAGIRRSAPVVEGVVTINDRPMRLHGIDPFAESAVRDALGSGIDLPVLGTLLTTSASVLLSDNLADRMRKKHGDTLLARRGAETTPLIIAGIFTPADEYRRRMLDGVIVTDISTAQDVLDMHAFLSWIEFAHKGKQEELEADVRRFLHDGIVLEHVDARSSAVHSMTEAFALNLAALSLLALLVGMFLIYDTISFSVVQRRETLSSLRALGATSRDIFRLIVLEATVLGSLGTLLGLILGILLGTGTVQLVTRTITDLYFTITVTNDSLSVLSLLKGIGLGIGASVFAAVLPAREAMTVETIAGMRRSSGEQRFRERLPKLAAVGVLLFLLAAIAFLLPGRRIDFAFFGVFAVLMGAALLVPAALRGTLLLFSRFLLLFPSTIVSMAARSIDRSLSRTSIAVAALMLAVSVIIGVNTMIGSFRSTVEDWLESTLGADIYISTPFRGAGLNEGVPRALVANVSDDAAVRSTAYARTVSLQSPRYGNVQLIAASRDIAPSRPYKWLRGSRNDTQSLLESGAVFVSEPFAWRHGITEQDTVLTLPTPSGAITAPLAGVYYDYASDNGIVLMHENLYRTYWRDTLISSVAIFLADGSDADVVAARLQQDLAPQGEMLVQSRQGLRRAAMDIFDRTFTVTIALQILAAFVAFIGVLSSLLAQQIDRKRETGLLRTLGMTNTQLRRLLIAETALLGMLAGLFALPVGLIMAYLLTHGINLRSFGWSLTLTVDGADIVFALLLSLTAALSASVVPLLRFSRLRIVEALRTE